MHGLKKSSNPRTCSTGYTWGEVPSPVPYLLKQSEVPSESEKSQILADIDSIVQAALNLEATKAELDSRLHSDALFKRNRAFVEFVIARCAILCPIRRMPVKVIQTIFSLAAEDNSPWMLSHVSRDWRAIALSLPLIWTKVEIDVTYKKICSASWKYVELLKYEFVAAMLRRSGNNPLHINIELDLACISSSLFDLRPIIELLASHSERWKDISVKAPLDMDILPAFKTVRGRLSSLRSLKLHYMSRVLSFGDIDDRVCDFFEIAPRLSVVHISGHKGCRFLLPWATLSSYQDDHAAQQSALDVLTLSTADKLSRLEIGALAVADPTLIPKRKFPNLQYLELSFVDHNFNPFVQLEFPAMKHLKIRNAPQGTIMALFNTIMRSFQISYPSGSLLTHAEIHEIVLQPEELVQFLSTAPQLESLYIDLPLHSDLKPLIVVHDREWNLVRRLRTLSFVVNSSSQRGYEKLLVDLASSRCDNPSPSAQILEHFSISFASKEVCIAQLERLEQISNPGVDWKGLEEKEDVARLRSLNLRFREAYGHTNEDLFDVIDQSRRIKCLEELESFDVKDVRHLYLSHIHTTLFGLTEAFPVDYAMFPTEKERRHRARVAALLERWMPMFLEDLPNRHWEKGYFDSCIRYVRNNHPLRTSRDFPKILFGDGWPLKDVDV